MGRLREVVDMGRVMRDVSAYEAALIKAKVGWRRMRAASRRMMDVLIERQRGSRIQRCTYTRPIQPGQRVAPGPCGGRMKPAGRFVAAPGATPRRWLECRTCGRRTLADREI